MTGKGKSITPDFRVAGKSFFPEGYTEKESARAIAKRFVNSKYYDGKSYFYKVVKEENRLIILDTKNNKVFPITKDSAEKESSTNGGKI